MSRHVVGKVSGKKYQVTLKKEAESSSEQLVAYTQICVVSSYEALNVLKFTLGQATKAQRRSRSDTALLFL